MYHRHIFLGYSISSMCQILSKVAIRMLILIICYTRGIPENRIYKAGDSYIRCIIRAAFCDVSLMETSNTVSRQI